MSCVGAIGFDMQGLLLGNGKANQEVAQVAKKAGVGKFVYVSVSSEVADVAAGASPGYFQGKAMAEEVRSMQGAHRSSIWHAHSQPCDDSASQAILDAVGPSCACFVKPTFIYGGDGFGLFPPRVSTGYGSSVEQLLSAEGLQKFADILPDFLGFIKVALRPPVSVDAVAACCTRAALGLIEPGVFDGTPSINAAADLPKPDPPPESFA